MPFVTPFVILCANPPAPPQSTRTAITLTDCALADVDGPVVCGTFEVPEDRGRKGRAIALNIAVLKATGTTRQPDPIVPLQGGPGQGSTQMADFYARTLAPLRTERDIVLIDVRGTGRSNPLRCDIAGTESLRSPDLLPPAAITACREAHERRADLRMYTTQSIARDLDDVRRAMGVDRWNLYGTSYGTRLAQEYIRLFPGRVRTATLKGIVPPSLTIPLPYARDAQTALDASIDAPTREQLTQVLAGLKRQAASATQDGLHVTISEGLFAEALRNLLYNPASAGTVARTIHSAAKGDFGPAAASIVRVRRAFSNDIALGLFLSVTCAEDIPRIDPSKIDDAVRNTFLGAFRVKQQMEACRLWNAGMRSADASTPLVSAVPALLFSGDLDPVTPPRFGHEVVRTLRNARHVVLKNNGHAMGASAPCITSMMKQLVERGSIAELDGRCAASGR